jgi:tetratricopeptide (TPR) repeat protein/predicted nucleic acid-binding protein
MCFGDKPPAIVSLSANKAYNLVGDPRMVETFLGGLFLKSAGWVLTETAKKAAKSLSADTPLDKAISSTGEVFPAIGGVKQQLAKWCESSTFKELFEKIKQGDRHLTDEDIVMSFVEVSGFYCADDTKRLAREILEVFAHNLYENLYKSDSGLIVHAGRQEVLHAKTQERLQQVNETIALGLIGIQNILPFLVSDDVAKIPKVQDKIHHARIDQARDLLLEGKAKTSRSILENLRKELSAGTPSADLLFRIATNLGVCALQLDDTEKATIEFREALEKQPKSAKALSNVSIAALLSGDYEEALRLSKQACGLEPREPNATAVQIQAFNALAMKEELESFLTNESWTQEDPMCAWVIGQIRLSEGNYQESERLLRNSINKGCKEPNALVLLSKVIIDPVRLSLCRDPPLPWRINDEAMKKIEEGAKLLDQAVEILEHHENRAHLHDALSNRGAIRAMLGQTDEALRDCDRVLSENENHLPAKQNKALILMECSKFSEAISLLEAARSKGEGGRLLFSLARAYSEAGVPGRVIDLLEPLWQPTSRQRDQIEIAEILQGAYSAVGDSTKVSKVREILNEAWPNDPEALRVSARQLCREKKPREAIILLNTAMGLAAGNTRDRIAVDLANAHYSVGEFAETAAILGEIVDKTSDNPIARRYLVCLYNAQLFREALVLAQCIRSVEGIRPVISEIEALILDSIGDLYGARDIWVELSKKQPEEVRYRLPLARLDFRKGDRESARQRLLAITYDEIKDNAEVLIEVAQERALLGIGGVLPLVYRARQIDGDNPEAHLAYISLFLSREELQELPPVPKVVGVDCSVHMRRNSETKVFTILDENATNRTKGELLITDALARKLVGSCKGDHIVLKDSPFEELSYEITEIQNKYVYAFQESLNDFTTRFPDHPGLYRTEFKENDFSKLFMAVDKRHEFLAQLARFYQDKGFPLSTVSRLAQSRIAEAWAGMMGQQGGRIIAALESPDDRRVAAESLALAGGIVLDVTALLTMGYLEVLPRLPKRFLKVIVPQAVLDELNETLAKNVLGGRPSGSIGKIGDYYVHREISREEVERGRKFLEDIRAFVEKSTDVVAAPTVLDLAKEQTETLRKILPECALLSVLVAKERGTLLYSDDFGLRKIAKNEWQVKGVWSQAILIDLCAHGLLTKEEYQDAIKNLILANYFFVSISHGDILAALRRNGMAVSREISRMFETLQGPDCDETSAVALAADFVRDVWLEPIMDHNKQMILDLTLNAISTNRLSGRVILKLKIALAPKLALLPIHQKEIMLTIQLWERQNLMRKGLVR